MKVAPDQKIDHDQPRTDINPQTAKRIIDQKD